MPFLSMLIREIVGFICSNICPMLLLLLSYLKIMVKTQFRSTIWEVQTDWGGEFCKFSSMLISCGIRHRMS